MMLEAPKIVTLTAPLPFKCSKVSVDTVKWTAHWCWCRTSLLPCVPQSLVLVSHVAAAVCPTVIGAVCPTSLLPCVPQSLVLVSHIIAAGCPALLLGVPVLGAGCLHSLTLL